MLGTITDSLFIYCSGHPGNLPPEAPVGDPVKVKA